MKKLNEIFDIWYGVNLELMRCEEHIDGIPFVSRTSANNGIVDVDYYFPQKPILEKVFFLNTNNWGWFLLNDIFKIYTSNDKNIESSDDGITPYISASQLNNGISNYVANEASQKENTLTVARNGSIGATFYHPYNYCVSPDDVRIFEPKFSFNKYIAIFISVLIEKEKYRYAYGRKFGTKRMMQTRIKLPINTSGQPDWQFMEDYIKSLPYSSSL